MISAYSFETIKRVTVDSYCMTSMPCQHHVKVELQDGREIEKDVNGIAIWHLIANLDNNKISQYFVDFMEDKSSVIITDLSAGSKVKEHFKEYEKNRGAGQSCCCCCCLPNIFKIFNKEEQIDPNISIRKAETVLQAIFESPKDFL